MHLIPPWPDTSPFCIRTLLNRRGARTQLDEDWAGGGGERESERGRETERDREREGGILLVPAECLSIPRVCAANNQRCNLR